MTGAESAGEPVIHREPPAYEPPRVTKLGTLVQLTGGIVPLNTDGVLPGSIIP